MKTVKLIAAVLVLGSLVAFVIEFWIHYMLQQMTPKTPVEVTLWSAVTTLIAVFFLVHWIDWVRKLIEPRP